MSYRWRPRHDLFGLGAVTRSCYRPSKTIFRFRNTHSFHTERAIRSTSSTLTPSTEAIKQRRKDVALTADTIYALSTAAGRAAIAVVRVSGPACLDIYGALCPDRPLPHPRVASLRKLRDPHEHERVLDTAALILYFPAPNTVTGDDVLELHVHGGPAVVRSVLEAIPRCVNARPRRRTAEYSHIRAAEPGEFTKRAFYNGRLDLTQAEALGETLVAETEQQRQLAVAGADGRLAVRYEEWRKRLLYARGELEALIDFSEDQHFDESPTQFMQSVATQVQELSRQIELHILNASRGELLRNGISVALLGAPNAGKSSLLNLVAGRDAAIVSPDAGTTRDIIDVSVDIDGWLVKLGDMAGLRGGQSTDTGESIPAIGQVEQEGIRRAKARALQSDLVITVIALTRQKNGNVEISITEELVDAVRQCQAAGKATLFVVNKVDLLPRRDHVDAAGGLRQRIVDVFPGTEMSQIYLLSCRDAALPFSASYDTSPRSLSDPGGVQTFLEGLTRQFTRMTSAATDVGPPSTLTPTNPTPSDHQLYWTASLSVTHRQSMYLERCQAHLEDFLAPWATPCAGPPPPAAASSHHVDGHEDLVGEKTTDEHETRGLLENQLDVVTAAEHLRYAADCLAKITGRGESGDVEDILGFVFEK